MSETAEQEWMDDLKFLPEFMRDFHDQKNLFKTIDETYDHFDGQPNFRDAQIYTIDIFLWYMATRGYTLQKSRKKFDFIDIQDELRIRDNERRDKANKLLNSLMGQDQ